MRVPTPYSFCDTRGVAQGVAKLSSGPKERFAKSGVAASTHEAVGPGSYEVPSHIIPVGPGPKRMLMGTTAERFGNAHKGHEPLKTPGPGSYDYEMPYGNLLKQTYNVAIAEQSADIMW